MLADWRKPFEQHLVRLVHRGGARAATCGRAPFVADHVDHDEEVPPRPASLIRRRVVGDLGDVARRCPVVQRLEDVGPATPESAGRELGRTRSSSSGR